MDRRRPETRRAWIQVAAAAGLALGAALAPAGPAAACWQCSGYGRYQVTPVVGDLLPKDGVIAFSLGTSACGDEIWEGLTFEVWTEDDDAPVAGTVEYAGELGAVYFRPSQPFTPGRSIGARVVVSESVPGSYDLMCGESVREAEVSVLVVDGATALPTPSTPTLEVTDAPIRFSFADVACCTGSAPSSDTCNAVGFDPSGCAPMYYQTLQNIVATPGALPKGQIAARLILDGEVVAGSVDGELADAVRVGPTCALLELEHLGTGEVARSPEVCTPPEVAATLGVHANDLASTLACDALENCDAGQGNYGWEWDPTMCAAIDPLALPPPAGGHGDWPRASTCGQGTRALAGPEAPTTPSPALQSGCGVASPGPGSGALVVVMIVGLRRRRRAGLRRDHG
ncbi:MAG: hypothetical protein R3B09_07995 [Nannocystaceae bacterium]